MKFIGLLSLAAVAMGQGLPPVNRGAVYRPMAARPQPMSVRPQPMSVRPATPAHGGGDGMKGVATGHVSTMTDPRWAYVEAKHGLRQSQFDLNYIAPYNQAASMDWWNDVSPKSFKGIDVGDYTNFLRSDAYNINVRKIDEAIEHHLNNPAESIDRSALRNLRSQRKSEQLLADGYTLALIDADSDLTKTLALTKRREDANRAQRSFQEAQASFGAGEMTQDKLWDKRRSWEIEDMELQAQVLKFMDAKDELKDYGQWMTYEVAEMKLERGLNRLDDARRAFRQEPTYENRLDRDLAKIATESLEMTKLARLGKITGDSTLTAYAWLQGGQLDEDYYEVVDRHLQREFVAEYGFLPGSRRRNWRN